MLPIDAIARNLRGWADTVLGIAVPATDLALGLATARARTRGQKSAIAKAGAVLRRMREAAGLTLEDPSRAVDLRDPELIANAERGVVALPFELIRAPRALPFLRQERRHGRPVALVIVGAGPSPPVDVLDGRRDGASRKADDEADPEA